MDKRIGLVAGWGRLPFLAIEGLVASGREPVVIGLEGEAEPELAGIVADLISLPTGNISRMVDHFHRRGVTEVIWAGKVGKSPVFTGAGLDEDFLALLASLPRKNDDAILRALADYFARAGLSVLPQAEALRRHLVPRGLLSRRAPDPREQLDIGLGCVMAKEIGALDFGQSVVVKNRAVLAVEAVEGTEETVRRGGRLGHGGAVLVKMSKPGQDPRFDVPTVGPATIAAMVESGVSALAIEAGQTFFIDREDSLTAADRAGLAVVAIDNDGVF